METKSLDQIKIDLESSIYYTGDPDLGMDFYIGDGAFDEAVAEIQECAKVSSEDAREWLSKHRDKYNDLAELMADFANYTRQKL